jgi:hypothetical protein
MTTVLGGGHVQDEAQTRAGRKVRIYFYFVHMYNSKQSRLIV